MMISQSVSTLFADPQFVNDFVDRLEEHGRWINLPYSEHEQGRETPAIVRSAQCDAERRWGDWQNEADERDIVVKMRSRLQAALAVAAYNAMARADWAPNQSPEAREHNAELAISAQCILEALLETNAFAAPAKDVRTLGKLDGMEMVGDYDYDLYFTAAAGEGSEVSLAPLLRAAYPDELVFGGAITHEMFIRVFEHIFSY